MGIDGFLRMKKTFFFTFALIAAAALCADAQYLEPRAVHPLPKGGEVQIDNYSGRGDAYEFVTRILAQYGLKMDQDVWEIQKQKNADETPNASALFRGGKRLIVFNKAFIDRVMRNSKDDWVIIGIAAHEIGHHLGNHVLSSTHSKQQAEREADFHAGFVLARLGANLQQSSEYIRWLPSASSSEYPTREQRLCEIGKGWRDGSGLPPVPREPNPLHDSRSCEGYMPDPIVYETEINRDIYGNDIKQDGQMGIPGIDLSTCAARCEEVKECKGFSFDRWYGWCFLKEKIVPSVLDPSSIIGVKRSGVLPEYNSLLPKKIQIIAKQKFHEKPYNDRRWSLNYGVCSKKCASDDACVALSFEIATRKCFLFSNVKGMYFDETAISGYKHQARSLPTPSSGK
jgi:hypothetical protein